MNRERATHRHNQRLDARFVADQARQSFQSRQAPGTLFRENGKTKPTGKVTRPGLGVLPDLSQTRPSAKNGTGSGHVPNRTVKPKTIEMQRVDDKGDVWVRVPKTKKRRNLLTTGHKVMLGTLAAVGALGGWLEYRSSQVQGTGGGSEVSPAEVGVNTNAEMTTMALEETHSDLSVLDRAQGTVARFLIGAMDWPETGEGCVLEAMEAGKTEVDDEVRGCMKLAELAQAGYSDLMVTTYLDNAAETNNLYPEFNEQIKLYPEPVQYWKDDILRWAVEYEVHPVHVATLMTIESCGDPMATSRTPDGDPIARGLFQVVHRFHSEPTDWGPDVLYEPEVSASRGLPFFRHLMKVANWQPVPKAYIGYNAGQSQMDVPKHLRSNQSQRYEQWSYIADDAFNNRVSMPVLQQWLQAGGASLCQKAAAQIGLAAQ